MEHVTWAEVDLDAIAHNATELKAYIGAHTILCAVVKANGYGHGALPVARVALESGAERLAVNRVEEGVELRQAGIEAPILVLGYASPTQAPEVVHYRLTPTVNSMELAQALHASVKEQDAPDLRIHLKIDTGLGRFGLLPHDVLIFAQALLRMRGLALEGVYTHFATADESDSSYTARQFELYQRLVRQLEEAGISIPIKHAANSAATLRFPDTHLDMVRCGIALYGLPPSPDMEIPLPLKPAMTLKSRVARVCTLPPGWAVGYGCTYVTTKFTPVALVPVGYGDGYHRALSNKGQVLIRGHRMPIVGRISMDQLAVNITSQPLLSLDEEVVLFGRQEEAEIRADEVAAWAGTINYEVVAGILPRVPRIYLRQ